MKHSVSGSSTIRTKPLLRLGDYHDSVLGSTIEWLLKTWHTVYSDPAYLSSPESDDSLELDDLSFVGGGTRVFCQWQVLYHQAHTSCQTATACTSSHSTSGNALFVFFNTLSIICPLCFPGSLFLPFAIDPCGKYYLRVLCEISVCQTVKGFRILEQSPQKLSMRKLLL